MTDALLLIYRLLPPWFVAGVFFGVAALWLAMCRRTCSGGRWIYIATPSAMLVAIGAALLGSFWVISPFMTDVPTQALAGLSRLLAVAMALTLGGYAIAILKGLSDADD